MRPRVRAQTVHCRRARGVRRRGRPGPPAIQLKRVSPPAHQIWARPPGPATSPVADRQDAYPGPASQLLPRQLRRKTATPQLGAAGIMIGTAISAQHKTNYRDITCSMPCALRRFCVGNGCQGSRSGCHAPQINAGGRLCADTADAPRPSPRTRACLEPGAEYPPRLPRQRSMSARGSRKPPPADATAGQPATACI